MLHGESSKRFKTIGATQSPANQSCNVSILWVTGFSFFHCVASPFYSFVTIYSHLWIWPLLVFPLNATTPQRTPQDAYRERMILTAPRASVRISSVVIRARCRACKMGELDAPGLWHPQACTLENTFTRLCMSGHGTALVVNHYMFTLRPSVSHPSRLDHVNQPSAYAQLPNSKPDTASAEVAPASHLPAAALCT